MYFLSTAYSLQLGGYKSQFSGQIVVYERIDTHNIFHFHVGLENEDHSWVGLIKIIDFTIYDSSNIG